ncbi:MAG: hypothetical protein KME22_00355 [Hassallia sp. WJT32-NPBG1]|jgi:hypothetical protein|nr:hypothetical protein [Hassallia sp. WJT32-NPBG1]
MSNKFTNNVRTRLYKAGYQGFTKDDYTAAAKACECEDLNNPTSLQLSQAVEFLIDKQSKQLASSPPETTTTEVLTETITEQSSIATASEDLSQLAIADTVNLGSMVTSKAAELGMILTPQQVSSIADTIDTSASTFDEILSDVETALLAYADYSANQVDAKIHASLTRVEERVVNRHQQSRDKLAQGLTSISTALEESRSQTKSQLGNILSRLKVQ